jgi:immune inhibitor A
VLVDFSDKAMPAGAPDRFSQLFCSTGELPNGSVKEYYDDVSRGLIDIQGEVVGPYRLPQTVAAYAGSDNGLQEAVPNARTMANDAVTLANRAVDFTPYDNDGDGYVDAFIVVHAGRGAEETGSAADIWSHKWVLPTERAVDGTKIYAYLTIPEDAKLGVATHELGHLLFGWPDLYDTDNTSEGIGNWCLMAAGSWGLGGDRPVHPSAWCKATQGWIDVATQTANTDVTIADVKTSRTAYRLWKDGGGGNEYFLVENRQQTGFDTSLPGQGLLIWHIDDAISDNTNESHYKVALMEADGRRQLENNVNRGDEGDPFPGSTGNPSFTGSSTPSSRSYAGSDTFVAVTGIPTSSPAMRVHLAVKAMAAPPEDLEQS